MELALQIIKGDRTALGKGITLLESTLPEHEKQAQELLAECLPHSGKSIRVGITGVPGVGKSTLIEVFGKLLTIQGKKVAVLAIDPTSEQTQGSILGDKSRMHELAANENAFIRPSPSSGTLGGVANKTRESVILCEAAGYDVILVETVGVGQSETTVSNLVDFFLLDLLLTRRMAIILQMPKMLHLLTKEPYTYSRLWKTAGLQKSLFVLLLKIQILIKFGI
jgi:LAO/AO transport system kinase